MEAASRPRDLSQVLERLLKIGFGIGGVTSLANGVWMLAAPAHWYEVFPGRVPDFGPLNSHFVMDLGGWYVAGGVLLLFALTNPMRFGGMTLIVTLIASGAHATTHLADVISGRVDAEHWIIDTPFIYAPLILLAVMLWIWWTLQSQRHVEGRSEPDTETEEKRPVFYNE
ncbi:MAG: hypothetical protein ACRDI1_07370 [Actinomycetota bacterium]|jgi:hypothetical protein